MFEGIIRGVKNIFVGPEKDYINYRIPQLITGKKFDLSQAEKIATVFTCVDIRSKTLAKLPLEKYKETVNGKEKDKSSDLYDLIHYNPNPYTTSYNFFSALETNLNLKGNAFALIDRNKSTGRAKGLYIILPSQVVDYIVFEGGLYYYVKIDPKKDDLDVVPAIDMLHFKMLTKDGIWGLNPIEALRLNLSATFKGMSTIDTFYDNNATSPKALKSTVSGVNQSKMIEAIKQFNEEFSGAGQAGKMVPLPPNTEIQELKLNFADAQFIDTVKFNANQISALFGVPAHFVGNTEASKFNNVEQMSIGFKADTISPVARMYRQELEMKLLTTDQRKKGESIEFNLAAMIETDHNTRLQGYKILSSIGAISANQISKIENLPIDPAGDVRMVPMNMMSMDKLLKNEPKIKPGTAPANAAVE